MLRKWQGFHTNCASLTRSPVHGSLTHLEHAFTSSLIARSATAHKRFICRVCRVGYRASNGTGTQYWMMIPTRIWREQTVTYFWLIQGYQQLPENTEKTCPSPNLSTTNPTWLDPGSNPGRRGGNPATNSSSYGASSRIMWIYRNIYRLPVNMRAQFYLSQVRPTSPCCVEEPGGSVRRAQSSAMINDALFHTEVQCNKTNCCFSSPTSKRESHKRAVRKCDNPLVVLFTFSFLFLFTRTFPGA
jgi:hypothetical protein